MDLLIPLHEGEQPLTEVYRAIRDRIGPVGAALPSNAEALPWPTLVDFLAKAQPERVHFLGVAAREKALEKRLQLVADFCPNARVSSDANRLRAWIGRGRRYDRALGRVATEAFRRARWESATRWADFDETEAWGELLIDANGDRPEFDQLKSELVAVYGEKAVTEAEAEDRLGDLVADLPPMALEGTEALLGGQAFLQEARERGEGGWLRTEAVREAVREERGHV